MDGVCHLRGGLGGRRTADLARTHLQARAGWPDDALRMPLDLVVLVPLDPPWIALDAFIGECLYDAGIWKSPATSDGIPYLARVLARGPDTLRVCGHIYEIDQTVHPFWLELQRDTAGHQLSWFLYFDVASLVPRRARDAVDSCEDPDSIEWIARLGGEARVDHGVLALVPGTTRVLLRDPVDRSPPRLDKGRRRRGRRRDG